MYPARSEQRNSITSAISSGPRHAPGHDERADAALELFGMTVEDSAGRNGVHRRLPLRQYPASHSVSPWIPALVVE